MKKWLAKYLSSYPSILTIFDDPKHKEINIKQRSIDTDRPVSWFTLNFKSFGLLCMKL